MPASSRTSEDCRRVRVARISQRAARERLREAVEKFWSRIKWTRLRRKQKTVDLLLSFAYFSSRGLLGEGKRASGQAGQAGGRVADAEGVSKSRLVNLETYLLYKGVGEFGCGKL